MRLLFMTSTAKAQYKRKHIPTYLDKYFQFITSPITLVQTFSFTVSIIFIFKLCSAISKKEHLLKLNL